MVKVILMVLGWSFAIASWADNLSDSNTLFDWAEQNYPEFFSPAGQQTAEVDGYLARYYPGTGNYLGTLGDDVYVYGDEFNGLLRVGVIGDFIQPQPEQLSPAQAIERVAGNWKLDIVIEGGAGYSEFYAFFLPLKNNQGLYYLDGEIDGRDVRVIYDDNYYEYSILYSGFVDQETYVVSSYSFTFSDHNTISGSVDILTSTTSTLRKQGTFVGHRQ